MFSQIQLIIGSVIVAIAIGAGWYVKSLNDQVVKCKANTKIQKARYDKEIAHYDTAIIDITKFYDGKIADIGTFKRRDNETDCEASKRFFNNTSY